MIKLLNGIPKNDRKAIYNQITGYSRLLVLPQFRLEEEAMKQYEEFARRQQYPKLYYSEMSFRGKN